MITTKKHYPFFVFVAPIKYCIEIAYVILQKHFVNFSSSIYNYCFNDTNTPCKHCNLKNVLLRTFRGFPQLKRKYEDVQVWCAVFH